MLATGVRRGSLDAGAVFALALACRAALVGFSSGGPGGNVGYDQAVYYTAADALIHGRTPYRDFTLLHPPALMLCLTPFAALGRETSDHLGFMAANAAAAVLGAISAALVVLVARRFAISRPAALLGGVFYAVWFGAASTEVSCRLEPLGSALFLTSLWCLGGEQPPTRRRCVLAGLAAGAAVTVKIWWFIPWAALIGWQLMAATRRRQIGWFLAGSAVAAVAIVAPFFALAPGAMWQMVVTDQIGRSRGISVVARLKDLTSVQAVAPHLGRAQEATAVLVVAAVVLLLGVAAWRHTQSRMLVVIALLQFGVLLAAPTYFSYYSGYPGAALALVVAAAAHTRRNAIGRAGLTAAAVVVTLATATTVAFLALRPGSLIQPFPGPTLARKVSGVRCVLSDSPMALIELNALSRGLAHNCPNWVDVSGRTYDVDATGASRARNLRWQADITHYLLSGDAYIIIRSRTGLSSATRKLLTSKVVLARSDGYVVYLP